MVSLTEVAPTVGVGFSACSFPQAALGRSMLRMGLGGGLRTELALPVVEHPRSFPIGQATHPRGELSRLTFQLLLLDTAAHQVTSLALQVAQTVMGRLHSARSHTR